MFPYHNQIKRRIKQGELTGYEYVDNYKGISPCLLLFFSCGVRIKPIRQHRFAEYEELLKSGG